MKLEILTPEWNRVVEDVEAVFIPGMLGEFEVLVNHAPIISTLRKGQLRWRVAGEEESLEVKAGAARVRDNVIQVCVEV